MKKEKNKISRNEFFKDFIKHFGKELSETNNQDNYKNLLPPGVISLEHYLENCSKCYDCVSACPHESLRIEHNSTHLSGFPIIKARLQPCFFCDDFPCIKSCPTDALEIRKNIKLGTAVLLQNICLSYQNHTCYSCVSSCPISGKAIYSDLQGHPNINSEICNGCGICENVCPVEPPAIIIK